MICPDDIVTLNQILKKTSKEQKTTPFLKTLLSCICICRKDKHSRLQTKTAEAFENNLDIRRLVD